MQSTNPWWDSSPPHSSPHHHAPAPHPYPLSDAMGLGHMLGSMAAHHQRQIEILLGLQERLIELPDRIADRLVERLPAPSSPPPAPAASPASAPPPGPTRMQQVTELLKALLPLALLVAIVAGKLTILEGVALIRHALGVAP